MWGGAAGWRWLGAQPAAATPAPAALPSPPKAAHRDAYNHPTRPAARQPLRPRARAAPVPPVGLLLLAQQALQVGHVVVPEVQHAGAGQVGPVLDGVVDALRSRLGGGGGGGGGRRAKEVVGGGHSEGQVGLREAGAHGSTRAPGRGWLAGPYSLSPPAAAPPQKGCKDGGRRPGCSHS